ncbi:class I SAM-dependent methyltransferase [Candidatus Daviesbacteria bacterium]|nr:class I SAM-dependent methyltransferase [Candidatus Daviesbacteria bacterium]
MSKYYENYWQALKNRGLDDFHYKWPAIKGLIPKTSKLKILDFGCGTGDILQQVIGINPNSQYLGIDVSSIALKKAKDRFPKAKFYHIEDGDKIPLKTSSIDFILMLDVIEHIYNTKSTIKELYRILKPGGKILLSTPYHGFLKNLILISFFFEQYFDPESAHIRQYSKKSLVSQLESTGFSVVRFDYFGRFFPVSRAMYVLAKK